MDQYAKPVTQYEFTHNTSYMLVRIEALRKALFKTLNFTKEPEEAFNRIFDEEIKRMDSLTLTDENIKNLVNRSNSNFHDS